MPESKMDKINVQNSETEKSFEKGPKKNHVL